MMSGRRVATFAGGTLWLALGMGPLTSAASDTIVSESPSPNDSATPRHAVVVRISEGLLQDTERAEINVRSDVRLVVLDTPVCGTAETTGVMSVGFARNRRDAAFDFLLRGTTVSQTVGRKGPARVCTVVASRFVAIKPVLFDLQRGFTAGRVAVDSRTSTVSRNVQASVPGIRGRLVEHVAWNRIERDRLLIDALAEMIAQQRIEMSFDTAATARLARLNSRFQELRLVLAANRARKPDSQVDLFTTNRYLEICIGPVGPKHAPALPEWEFPDHPLQVWIYSSVIGTETAQLLKTWELLRRVILPRAIETDTQGIQLQTVRGGVPLHVATLSPWVVIGAGEPEPTGTVTAP
jgi:hypothetical protein